MHTLLLHLTEILRHFPLIAPLTIAANQAILASDVVQTLTAGVALTAGWPVRIDMGGAGGTTTQSQTGTGSTNSLGGSTSSNLYAMAIQITASAHALSLTTIILKLAQSGTLPSGLLNVAIYTNVAGAPGVQIGTIDTHLNANAVSGTATDYTFTVNAPMIPGVVYWIVLSGVPGTGGGGTLTIIGNSTGSGMLEQNGFGAWASSWGTFQARFQATFTLATSGQVLPCSSASAEAASGFVGFAQSSVAASASINVILSTVVTGLSGLTPGQNYYLNDVNGTIGTSAGTVTRKVGTALTATTLIVNNNW